MKFELQGTAPLSKARAGKIETDHGQIDTPIFMPIGTIGSVKGIHFKDIKDGIGVQIIIGNPYHLYLRPGVDIIDRTG